jgi:membrane protein YqaA with SNARE-associated domain
MQAWISDLISWLLTTLSLPEIGLSAIFIVSLVSATLLPLGSEPAVFAYINLAPDMFWPAVLVATVGNTAGGGDQLCHWPGCRKSVRSLARKAPAKHRGRKHAQEQGRWSLA